ncbi:MAG: N-acetylmuramoyl-L-alanine amidase [Muricomes sp.]
MRIAKRIFLILCAVLFLAGCAEKPQKKQIEKVQEEETQKKAEQEIEKQRELEAQRALEEQKLKEAEAKAQEKKSKVIVLDPGHSAVVAEGTEPLGPGSPEQKAADTSGTSGISSGVPEYELTLNISVQLKKELENRGYTVLMTRESNDIPMSCIARAEVANNAGADAYVRIHANGSDDQAARGAMTICTTPGSPYVPELYTPSRQLSDLIIHQLCETTGCKNEGVWETDSMSGNNWSKVPVTIVEMGYMTNPEEDMLMQTPEYQEKIVQGIAAGIDAFLGYDSPKR